MSIQKKTTKPKGQKILRGIPASPGVRIGKAYVLDKAPITLPHYWVNHKEFPGEIDRFNEAIEKTRDELERILDKISQFEGREQISILEAYRLILDDEMIYQNTLKTIQEEHINAEWALQKNLNRIQKSFKKIEDPYLKERSHDFLYVGERILNHLTGKSEEIFKHVPQDAIIVASDLSPAETSQLTKFKIQGLITEAGGATSHTAIISQALQIPSVVGCLLATKEISTTQEIVIDGTHGQVWTHPSKQELENFKNQRSQEEVVKKNLLKEIHLPAETKDQHRIQLMANMELPEELHTIKEQGAEGIGLYRTEFLYLNQEEEPSEAEQRECYQKVLKSIYPNYATIRTLDLGGDKVRMRQPHRTEQNPALGMRAIRLSLKEQDRFKTQLRAMLASSLQGKLKILFPLICDIEEIRKAKEILEKVKAQLKQENIPFDPDVKIGVMIEVPSSVLIAEELAKEVDFFSIGTNDLIQYTLAIDRGNEDLAYLYQPLHPAVLRLIKQTINAAEKAGISVSLCGEMAGNPLYTLILIGLGLHELSMNALSIPRAKRMIRSLNFEDCQKLARRALTAHSAQEVEQLVRQKLKAHFSNQLKEFGI